MSRTRRAAALILRSVLGLTFIWAGVYKIADPQGFALMIANYRILPQALIAPAAVILPWIETVCGLALTFNRLATGAAALISAMLTTFMSAMAYNLARGLDIACGCFSTDPAQKADMALSLARDAGLAALGLIVLWLVISDQGQGQARQAETGPEEPLSGKP
ncbi:MAG: DoxX family membrane protein [Desulfovibrionaceae bacterium]|nr:DoxX family membrane protein [Desulfovibrionaceae bacterium]